MSDTKDQPPLTRGEMDQFEKRMVDTHQQLSKGHTQLSQGITALTDVVSKLAENTQQMLGENKATRVLIDRLMDESKRRSDELVSKVDNTDERMKEFEIVTRSQLSELQDTVNALEVKAKGNTEEIAELCAVIDAQIADKLDWRKWRSRLAISSGVSIVVLALGVLIKAAIV